MPNKFELLINPQARKSAIQKAENLAREPGVVTSTVQFPVKSFDTSVRGLIVIGGDGTVNAVVQAMIDQNFPGTLFVTESGTYNALYKTVKKRGALVSPSSLGDEEIPTINLRPGLIDDQVFHSMAEVGVFNNPQFSNFYVQYRDALRSLGVRKKAWQMSIFMALFQTLIRNPTANLEPKIILNKPNFGRAELVPEQTPESSSLSLVRFTGRDLEYSPQKTLRAFFYLALGKKPPPNTYFVERAPVLQSDELATQKSLLFDGETRILPRGISAIKKSEKILSVSGMDLFSG